MAGVMDTFQSSPDNFCSIGFMKTVNGVVQGWAEPDTLKMNILQQPNEPISNEVIHTLHSPLQMPYYRRIYELSNAFFRQRSSLVFPREVLDICFIYVGTPEHLNTISDIMTTKQIQRMSKKDWRLKCVLVGDSCAGKTSLFISYVGAYFPQCYCPQTAPDHVANIMLFGQLMSLHLHDTNGQADYDGLRPFSYSGTDVFLICVPTHCGGQSSKWKDEIRQIQPDAPIILVGTQTDFRDDIVNGTKTHLSDNDTIVQREDGVAMADLIGARCYVECSALTTVGVRNVFEVAIESALKSDIFEHDGSRCCVII